GASCSATAASVVCVRAVSDHKQITSDMNATVSKMDLCMNTTFIIVTVAKKLATNVYTVKEWIAQIVIGECVAISIVLYFHVSRFQFLDAEVGCLCGGDDD